MSSAAFFTQSWHTPGEGGLFSASGMNVVLELTIDSDVHIDDPAAFVKYTSAILWSINDKYPKGDAKIVLDGGVSQNFDWTPFAAEALSLDPEKVGNYSEYAADKPIDYTGRSAIVVPVTALSSAFGRWPGTAPAEPPTLFAAGPPAVITPPSITHIQAQTSGGKDVSPGRAESSKRCWTVTFDRTTTTGAGTYAGAVTVVLTAEGTEIDQRDVVGGSRASFCYAEDEVPAALTNGTLIRVTVTTATDGVFAPVAEELDFS